jgi:hypothetical protein
MAEARDTQTLETVEFTSAEARATLALQTAEFTSGQARATQSLQLAEWQAAQLFATQCLITVEFEDDEDDPTMNYTDAEGEGWEGYQQFYLSGTQFYL